MKKQNERAATVEEYLASVPPDVGAALQKIRTQVKTLVPTATEKISYGMPTFFTHRALVGYAAHNHHCSFYPWSGETLKNFKKVLSGFETSAGTVRFTVDQPLPASLIKKIVLARLIEHDVKDKVSKKNPKQQKAESTPFSLLAAPAQRALAGAGIRTLKHLTQRREPEVAALHGMGPNALNVLRTVLKHAGLSYKK